MNNSIALIISSSNLITDDMKKDDKKFLEREHERRENTMIIARHMFEFNGIKPIVLYNSTLDQLKETIDTNFKYYDDNCVSYIYINCHGNTSGLSMVLNGSTTSHVTYSDLKKMLDKINGTKVLMIESCHSGASITQTNTSKTRSLKIDHESESTVEQVNKAIISTFSAPKSNPHLRSGELRADKYQVITACSETEDSWGNQDGDYFTRYWSEGAGWNYKESLRTDLLADKDKKGYVTLQDLCDYTKKKTIKKDGKKHEQNDMCYPENSDFPIFGIVPISFMSSAIDEYYRKHKDIYKSPIGPVNRYRYPYTTMIGPTAYQNYSGGVIVRYPNGKIEGFTRFSYVLNRIRQILPKPEGPRNDTMELYIEVTMTQDDKCIVNSERWPRLSVRNHGGTDYNIIYEGDAVKPDHPANSNVFYSSDVLNGKSRIILKITVWEYDIPNEDDKITTYNFGFGIENGWGFDGIGFLMSNGIISIANANNNRVYTDSSQVVYKNIGGKWVSLDITVKKM